MIEVVILGLASFFCVGQAQEYNYDGGPECIVHHPPHNEEFSCGSLCDPSLLEADFVTAVFLTGFYANFDCLINKTSIKVSHYFIRHLFTYDVDFFGCQKLLRGLMLKWYSVEFQYFLKF